MFPFPQVIFSSAGEMEIESVVIEEVLVELLNVFFRRDLTVTVQGLEGSSIKKRLQINIRRVPREGRVDRDPGCRSPQNGGDIKDGGTDGTKRKNQGVSGRAPEAQGG
ncbi:hypothetical protein ACFX1Z_046742 [Malus domestica]